MLAVISPAKRLDFTTRPNTKKHSQAEFLGESKKLIKDLRHLSPKDISSLMGISASLAELNYNRYAQWQSPVAPGTNLTGDAQSKQAILAFKGDVYLGLEAQKFNERDFNYAQKHLRILSGLYGLLRPLDLIAAYRLEMGVPFNNPRGKNLYEFWGDRVTNALRDAVIAQQSAKKQPVVINLASNEYAKVVDWDSLDAKVITPTFKDLKNGQYKFLSFFAKKARGLMSGYLIKNRVKTLSALKQFDWHGYYFQPELSDDTSWTFVRDKPV